MLGLLAGAVGEPHDRKPGHAALEVSFHLDAPSLEPDDGVRERAREQASQARQEIRTEQLPFLYQKAQDRVAMRKRWAPAALLPLIALVAGLAVTPAAADLSGSTPLRIELDTNIDYVDPALA